MVNYFDLLNLYIAQMAAAKGMREAMGIVVMVLGLCAIIFHRRVGSCMARFQKMIAFTNKEGFFQKERNCQIAFIIFGIISFVSVALSLLGYIKER